MRKLFTSESVTEGHPDKVCDRISDAVLDAVLAKDSEGRVACETCCTTDTVFIAGEITSKVDVDIEGIAGGSCVTSATPAGHLALMPTPARSWCPSTSSPLILQWEPATWSVARAIRA